MILLERHLFWIKNHVTLKTGLQFLFRLPDILVNFSHGRTTAATRHCEVVHFLKGYFWIGHFLKWYFWIEILCNLIVKEVLWFLSRCYLRESQLMEIRPKSACWDVKFRLVIYGYLFSFWWYLIPFLRLIIFWASSWRRSLNILRFEMKTAFKMVFRLVFNTDLL